MNYSYAISSYDRAGKNVYHKSADILESLETALPDEKAARHIGRISALCASGERYSFESFDILSAAMSYLRSREGSESVRQPVAHEARR